MIFKRKKKAESAEESAQAKETAEAPAEETSALSGPFDADDRPNREGYIDLGSLLIEPVEGMQLRLEVEDKTKRVIAVALELEGSRLQLQTFAASKSGQLWPGIQSQIAAGIEKQGGRVDKIAGRFGEELVARVPGQAPDGTAGFMVARFLGVDGPRWFLRGVIGGPAALDRAKAQRLEEVMARAIVVRGHQPMPPSELLPLKMPDGAVARQAAQVAAANAARGPQPGDRGAGSPGSDGPTPPERGPEITQIG